MVKRVENEVADSPSAGFNVSTQSVEGDSPLRNLRLQLCIECLVEIRANLKLLSGRMTNLSFLFGSFMRTSTTFPESTKASNSVTRS